MGHKQKTKTAIMSIITGGEHTITKDRYNLYQNADGGTLDYDTGRIILLICCVLIMANSFLQVLFPIPMMKACYFPYIKDSVLPLVGFLIRFLSLNFFCIGLIGVSLAAADQVPAEVFLAFGATSLVLGIFMGFSIFTGKFGIKEMTAEANMKMFHKQQLYSWAPVNILIGVLLMMAADTDRADFGEDRVDQFKAQLGTNTNFDIVTDAAIDDPSQAVLALLVYGIMLLLNGLGFVVAPVKTWKSMYVQEVPEDYVPWLTWISMAHGICNMGIGAMAIALYSTGMCPPAAFLGFGVAAFAFAVVILHTVTMNKHFKEFSEVTKQTTFNKMQIWAWPPMCCVFGLVFLLCCDFDAL